MRDFGCGLVEEGEAREVVWDLDTQNVLGGKVVENLNLDRQNECFDFGEAGMQHWIVRPFLPISKVVQ